MRFLHSDRWFFIFLVLPALTLLQGCTNMLFYPLEQHVLTPDRLGLQYEDVYFKSNDGLQQHAWFLPAKGESKASVFFLHGNAENISTHIGSVYWMPEAGLNVFLLEYRGYGKSTGIPDLDGIMQDMESGMRTLLAREDIDPHKIIVFGQSMGGAIAVYAVANSAYRQHIKALIIESAFSDYRRITRDVLSRSWLTWPFQWPLSFLIDNSYSPEDYIDKISPIPLLIIHGVNDRVVPYAHGERLYMLAKERKQIWTINYGRHIDANGDSGFRRHLVDYIESVANGG